MPLFHESPELLPAFRQGRREALERVYAYYARSIDAYLRTLASGAVERGRLKPDLAADLIQDVFIRAFSAQARAAYDGKRRYGPYLRTIAKNCLIDTLRASGREILIGESDWPEGFDEASDSNAWLDPKVRHVLQSYLRDLPAPLRGVYEQRFMLGHSQRVACEALGLTRASLRTFEGQLKRGLKRALCAAGVLRNDLAPASRRARTDRGQRHVLG